MPLVNRILPAVPYANLDEYLAAGGGRALAAARRVEPEALVAEVESSGLRGRGGAGFPTGIKWRTIVANASSELATTVVVNAAEGEPGTYKDRTILRLDPYSVLEGALVALYAVGAGDVVVALKARETTERERVERAIDEMVKADLLGGVEVSVVGGPHEYLFGEETALLEVVDGRAPLPRIAPPYRRGVVEVVEHDDDVASGSGLSAHVEMAGPDDETLAPPALVDNVETLANVAHIIAEGAAWFREMGTEASPGTVVCTVTGDVVRPGVGEIPLGTTVREAIDAVAGGPDTEHPVKAVLNGVSGAPLPAALLDTPLTYEDMAGVGSGLGTASLMVVGEGTDMTAVAAGVARFLAVESCGQCTPCKADGLTVADALDRLCAGTGGQHDLDGAAQALSTVADGARCNLASQQQAVVGAILAGWDDEVVRRATGTADAAVEPYLVAEVVRIDEEGDVTLDEGRRTKQPDWTHDAPWSGSYPADELGDHASRHDID
ncbi:MAG TPA: NADH-ubiquinone oxidoreductase-F iron-sulfur binding region domain-containing protein [Acidimicrobiales bacterium]|nr:NADH-ubiquinone oxidoreductase-F iron-sulfur binding region domain-containing protein [Acidimicrobiales bacterium]